MGLFDLSKSYFLQNLEQLNSNIYVCSIVWVKPCKILNLMIGVIVHYLLCSVQLLNQHNACKKVRPCNLAKRNGILAFQFNAVGDA